MTLIKRKRIENNDEEKNEMSIGTISAQPIASEIKSSYLEYAMSVIVSRALPDARDGLKPVHRRILYAMWSMGLKSGGKFRKSATVVGEVLGKYHPHGDTAVYDSMVRMAQDFNLRYPLIHGQGNFGCFTKDTKIKLTDGRDITFEDLVCEFEQGKKNYTYTVTSQGTITIAEIKNPRITRKNADLIKVYLDNGHEIRCTPNHLFMLRDGSYKEAQYLKSHESLMPLYTRFSEKTDYLNREGYLLVHQINKDSWIPAHHLADNYNLTNYIYTKQDGRVRHHVDFNKLNNNPDNILRLSWKEHWKIHYTHAKEQHKNPAYREAIAIGRKKFWDKLENRALYSARLSKKNKLNWNNQIYRENKRAFLSEMNKNYIKNHPDVRKRMAETGSLTFKKLWKIPQYRNLFHEKITATNKCRITNNTGKKKFLSICKAVLTRYNFLHPGYYEELRCLMYPYGSATTWETGINKYFQGNTELILQAINNNHRVVRIESLHEREDVYDLTIENTHNFALSAGVFVHNSMDGDPAAAMRYTEAKLSKIAEEMLIDIEKNTVEFGPNYDNTQKEPLVLPSLLPNLLLNGTLGIAVGMATNIPPHNITELCNGIVHLIENPDTEVDELVEYIKGPDFPTAGIIYSKKDILNAYATGRGGIVMRGEAEIEETKDGSFHIVITSVPYQVNKADLITKIAELVRDKKLEGIKDLRDESSDREGVRVVVELKKDSYPKKVLNSLYQHTSLQNTFHFNMLSLVNSIQPRVLTLKTILEEYIEHRKEVVKRRAEYDLKRAMERAHILEGLVKAQAHIDEVIKTIKQSKDRETAKNNLIVKFKLSEIQSNAILDMRLAQLAALERQKLEDELKEKKKLIAELEDLLSSTKKILSVVKKEVIDLREKFGDERKTKIVANGVKEFSMEDLVPDENTLVVLTKDGYIKRIPPDTFRTQGRGGKGVIGVTTKDEDIVENLFTTSTHSDIMFFTTRGRVFQLKAYDIPQGSRTAKGQALVNFLQLGPAEKVCATLSSSEMEDIKYLVMVTRKGIIKKVNIADFSNVRRSGLIAMKMRTDDALEWIKPSSGKDDIILVTNNGMAIRFQEKDVRPMGRVASGVRGMKLKGMDTIVGMDVFDQIVSAKIQLLTVTEDGYGKRTPINEYRKQGRGGSGILTAKVTAKTGNVVAGYLVNSTDERDLLVISVKGQMIRTPLNAIRPLSRATQGVSIMKFKQENDKVASITLI